MAKVRERMKSQPEDRMEKVHGNAVRRRCYLLMGKWREDMRMIHLRTLAMAPAYLVRPAYLARTDKRLVQGPARMHWR